MYEQIQAARRTLLLLLCLSLTAPVATAQGLRVAEFQGQDVVAGSIVVQYDDSRVQALGKASAVQAQLADVRAGISARVSTISERVGLQEWQIRGDMSSTLERLNALPGVRAIPNYIVELDEPQATPVDLSAVSAVQADTFPNDPYLGLLWGLNNDGSFEPGYSVEGADISAPSAWALSTGSADVVAVVFDSGIDIDHPDLAGNIWENPGEIPLNGVDDDGNGYVDDVHGWNAFAGSGAIEAGDHGTHVAGTIGAVGNNSMGVVGVNWDVQIISVGIFNADGSTSVSTILGGYDYVTALLEQGVPVTVVNQSWGGSAPFDSPFVQQLVGMYQDVALLHDQYGTIWVCSAGNDAVDNDEANTFRYPSSIQAPNIISVGSTDTGENPSSFSNIGLYTVDVGAPGTDILSTVPNGSYASFSGTSMASPHVSGAVALLRAHAPDDSHRGLIARILAGADRLAQYEALWTTGGRLNAYHALEPSAIPELVVPPVGKLSADVPGLVKSSQAGYVFKSAGDPTGVAALGFANATGETVEVTDVSISGPDGDAFALYSADATTATVPAESGYGIAFLFAPTEQGRREYEATLTMSTSAGALTYELYGLDQPISLLRIEPDAAELGLVPRGTEFETAFTIFNDGDDSLQYQIMQTLVAEDEAETASLAARTTFVPEQSEVTKPQQQVDRRAEEQQALAAALESVKLPSIEVRPDARLTRQYGPQVQYSTDPNLQLLFYEDFEDTATVQAQWAVLDVGAGDVFELHDLIEGEDTTDYVFLAGDLENGYQANTLTAAASPVFDFASLSEAGYGPYYLTFQYAAEVETGNDAFYVNAIVNGELWGTVAHTAGALTADGTVREARIDITPFIGAGSAYFLFVLSADGSVSGGFGALFDNVGLIVGDAPYFASSYRGEVTPGGSEDISVAVRSGLLPEGEYSLFSEVVTNAVNNAGIAGHELSFRSEDFNVVFEPETSVIGEQLYRDSTATTSFTAANIAPAALPFQAFTGVSRLDEEPPDTLAAAAAHARVVQAEVSTEKPRLEGGHVRPLAQINEMLYGEESNLHLAGPAAPAQSRIFARAQDQRGMTYLMQDFDASTDFPSGWALAEYTGGAGAAWQVTPLSAEDNVVLFGDLQTGTYTNNSASEVFSPILDFSEVTPDSALFLEFDYASFMEAGYDFFVVYANILNDDDEIGAFEVLASSEDALVNDGTLNTAMIDVSMLRGERVQFSFYVETDVAVNAGLALFDEVKVYTDVLPVWVEPAVGTIPAQGTQEFTVGVNASDLAPGSYEGFTVVESVFDGGAGDEVTQDVHFTLFEVLNRAPVAVRDTIAVLAGDVIPLADILPTVLANDRDPDEDMLSVYDYTEPLFGDLKRTGLGQSLSDYSYVAPFNYEGLDSLSYVVTDGFDASEAATVVVEVHAEAGFVSGSQQNFALLEDHSLAVNAMMMASGVGGMNENLMVWATTDAEELSASYDASAHTLTFTPDANAYGQYDVTLYVGEEADASDSLDITVVVAPVNDAPVADFEFDVDGPRVSFTSTSSDALDPNGSITSYEWAFADGTTSTDAAPAHSYAEKGTYEVTLTVTDNAGATATISRTIEVATGTALASEEVPVDFVLEQNYPNPFNPSTTVRFGLPEAQVVTLRVYNALGQVVHTFYDGATLAPGYHDVSIDMSRLASGIYLYQLEAIALDGGQTLLPAKKMVLVR